MHGDQVQIYTGLSNSLLRSTSAMVEVPDSLSSTGGVILGTLREVEKTRKNGRYSDTKTQCLLEDILLFEDITVGFRQEEVKKRIFLTFFLLMP